MKKRASHAWRSFTQRTNLKKLNQLMSVNGSTLTSNGLWWKLRLLSGPFPYETLHFLIFYEAVSTTLLLVWTLNVEFKPCAAACLFVEFSASSLVSCSLCPRVPLYLLPLLPLYVHPLMTNQIFSFRSLHLQQYRNGFNEEFKNVTVSAKGYSKWSNKASFSTNMSTKDVTIKNE